MLYMEYLKNLHHKVPTLGGPSKHDASVTEMYSCGHECKDATVTSNVLGVIVSIALISYIIYSFMGLKNTAGMLSFTSEHEISKMFIGLMLLTHIKTLSNSLIANVMLPIVKPLLPLLCCNLHINIGLFEINIGEFISDVIVFMMNIYVIYFMFSILS